jgi:hypothetical protein
VADELDAGTIAFAHRMFDLARSGATADLAGYVAAGLSAAGVSANLTNDPAGGSPAATETAAFFDLPETAAFFDLPEMAAMLREHRGA